MISYMYIKCYIYLKQVRQGFVTNMQTYITFAKYLVLLTIVEVGCAMLACNFTCKLHMGLL